MKRFAAMLLALALAATAAGCGAEGRSLDPVSPDASATPPVSSGTIVNGVDTTEVARLATPVMVIDGDEVSFSELQYQIGSLMDSYEYYGEGAVNWEEQIDGMPAREFFLNEAINTCKLFRAVERYAAANGYALSDERQAELSAQLDEYIESIGGEDAFERQLTDNGMTRELYDYLLYLPELYYVIYTARYGEGGPEEITDDAVRDYYSQNYLTTRHILKNAVGEDGYLITGDAAAAKLTEALELRDGIMSDTDFADLAERHSDDATLGGEAMTFELSTMPDAYVSAARELLPGSVSSVVDIGGAYVIIKREELDMSYLDDNMETLREELGLQLMRELLEPVRDALDVERTPAFDEMVDVGQIYDFFFG